MHRDVRPALRLVLCSAMLALGCGPAAPEGEDDDAAVDLGASEQGVGVTCGGQGPCSGTASVLVAAYRVGHTATRRAMLLQTFQATSPGAPLSVAFVARRLRASLGTVPPALRVEIYGPLDPAQPSLAGQSAIAAATTPVAGLSSASPTVLSFTAAPPLTSGATYGLVFSTDGAAGSAGSGVVLVGIGAIPGNPYAGGRAHLAASRESGGNWSAPALQPAGSVDLAFALTVASAGAPAYCWGSNNSGQVGDGTTTTRTSPVAVSGGLLFTKLAAGGAHTCGLDAAGHAWCWGSNPSGQLGNGTTYTPPRCSPFPRCTPIPPTQGLVPTAVLGNHVFTQLVAGSGHTCGLDPDGAAWCWGDNGYGALGDGTQTNRLVPTAVTDGHVFKALAASFIHTCGVDTAGAAWCWGNNSEQRLGDGTSDFIHATPSPVVGGHTFVAISAGTEQSCALEASGQAYCWGYNAQGAVGNGSMGGTLGTATAVTGGHVFRSIHTTGGRSFALDADGFAWGWGFNGNGQLGVGDTSPRAAPTALAGNRVYKAFAIGSSHGCGVTPAGAAFCWGLGAGVGNGSGSQENGPAPVAGGRVFSTIAAGGSVSCGLVP